MQIANIIDAIQAKRIRITDHADEEAESDQLAFDEVYSSVIHGEIIEDYPDDRPYPSCLIYGQNFSGDPVHSVWAFNDDAHVKSQKSPVFVIPAKAGIQGNQPLLDSRLRGSDSLGDFLREHQ